jgi:pyruvate/2-oxoglutarate dehydrogenase complex dihydrolipoamide dehydrogenase (E3) component
MATETQPKKFSCIVLGSGQSGTPLAVALAQSGRTTALIEREHLGGTCVNVGCTPTKTMIASGRAAYMARRGEDYGVWNVPAANVKDVGHKAYHSADEGGWENINVAVDMQKVRQRKRDIVDRWRGGSERRVADKENLEVMLGDAKFKDAHTLILKMNEGGEEVEVEAETIFINTGERPLRPDLPGLDSLDQSRVLDSTSVMELGEVPHHLIVLGGGYIGLEFGQLFRRLGAKVTVIQRGKQLVPREDAEIAENVKEIMEQDGMHILLNTTVANLKPDNCGNVAHKIILFYTDSNGHNVAVNGSHLLLATGRTPNTDTLDLAAAGIETGPKGHIKVNDKLQTNVPHIYALGDVHGGPAFTHVSYDDMRVIKANFLEGRKPALTIAERPLITPYVMYIDPQLGHVGLHEHEASAKYPNAKIKTASMPMSYVARASETDEPRGMMKAVVNADDGSILGFTCLGLEGGEIMSIVQTAMMGKLKYEALQNAIYAHPTLAESLNNLWGYLK